jgi:hypothetical protein
MKTWIATVAAISAWISTSAYAQQEEDGQIGEVALSNDTLQLRYVGDAGAIGGGGRLFGSFFLSEERDIVLSAGALFPADFDVGRLTLRFGPQVYAALLDEENNDVMAMSVGAQARFVLNRRMGLAVAGEAFYSPDILTFGSADNLTDLSARVELQAGPQLLAFGGMRWFEFDLVEGGGERTLQEEVFVGVGYRF